jgi:S1-C subfamily serine protease
MVAEVVPNGPAARAGLRGISRTITGRVVPGDIIVAVNDERIEGTVDFQRVVGRLRPGDRVRVRFLRDDEEQEATLVLQGV